MNNFFLIILVTFSLSVSLHSLFSNSAPQRCKGAQQNQLSVVTLITLTQTRNPNPTTLTSSGSYWRVKQGRRLEVDVPTSPGTPGTTVNLLTHLHGTHNVHMHASQGFETPEPVSDTDGTKIQRQRDRNKPH